MRPIMHNFRLILHIYSFSVPFFTNYIFLFDANTTGDYPIWMKNAIINIRVGSFMLPFT